MLLTSLLTKVLYPLNKIRAERIVSKLANGIHKTDQTIIFFPQRETADFPWQNFGWKEKEDYDFWKERICAISCLKMVLSAFHLAQSQNIAQLAKIALDLGGYVINDQKGRFVDKGWYHKSLLQLAKNLGLEAKGFPFASATQICTEILKNRLIIASVDALRLKTDTTRDNKSAKSINHLIVINGFEIKEGKWGGFWVFNPSSNPPRTEAVFIDQEIFNKAFNKRFMSFRLQSSTSPKIDETKSPDTDKKQD